MEHAARQIVQIVPGLAPKVDGIGDYALQLALQLRKRHGIETTFLVADPSWSPGDTTPEFPAIPLAARNPTGFLESLQQILSTNPATPLLQHVAAYGYEKRGVPFWLAESLERCAQTLTRNIHLCFHELERTGAPPWSSGFWVPPFQRKILRRIAAVGRYRYTNTELHRHRLESMGVGRISLIPNFSTITEPLTIKPFPERRTDLVVFGRAWQRRHTYEAGNATLQTLCRQLGIERIVDIGPPLDGDPISHIGETPVLSRGRLSAEDVSEGMSSAIGHFVVYPAKFLTKSSVHAVAAAHGTLNFVYDDSREEVSCPGLETGVDFIPVHPQSANLAALPLNDLATLAYSNYQQRASWAAADTLALNLFGPLAALHA